MTKSFLIAAISACTSPSHGPELVFVRDGIISPEDTHQGRLLTDGRRFHELSWRQGESTTVGGLTGLGPARAECEAIFHVPLGDVSRHVAMGGEAPNTALQFSPNEELLAIGTATGHIWLVDGWTGSVIAETRLAETSIKTVAWSIDGETLYTAEQSPDAFIHALDPNSLAIRWSNRLADIVGSSPVPDESDVYGLYTLPSAYSVNVLASDELIVTALHSWPTDQGQQNASQIVKISPEGLITDRWPDQPADATFTHAQFNEDKGLLAFVVGRSASGPPPSDLPIGGVLVLSANDLEPVLSMTIPPLKPWFDTSQIWEAIDISTDGDLVIGLYDGRIMGMGIDGETQFENNTGTPIHAGSVPIVAAVSWAQFSSNGILATTSATSIPFGSQSTALRPPTAHPNENTLWAIDSNGDIDWKWSGRHVIQGLTQHPDTNWVVTGAGDRTTDTRRDLYGALVFDTTPERDLGPKTRLMAICPTQGPVYFRQAVTTDGRIAVAEHPWVETDGTIGGKYQATVLR